MLAGGVLCSLVYRNIFGSLVYVGVICEVRGFHASTIVGGVIIDVWIPRQSS